MPAVHRRRDAQQIVPPVGDQLGVQSPGQQRPCQRMTRDELLGWAGAVEGDLAQVTDAGRELLADKIEQSKVGEGGAVGVGGVLHDRQIGVVAEHPVEHVVALRGGGHDHLGVERRMLIRDMAVGRDALAAGEIA